MKFTSFYERQFVSKKSGIHTSRSEWESAPCPIDMTRITDEEMQQFVDKFYIGADKEVFFDVAEYWLITKTKAIYLEDYSKIAFKAYGQRAKELYYEKN